MWGVGSLWQYHGAPPTAQPKRETERRLLGDAVLCEPPPVLQLLPGEHEALLSGRNPCSPLELRAENADVVGGPHVERRGLAVEIPHEDLYPPTRRVPLDRKSVV